MGNFVKDNWPLLALGGLFLYFRNKGSINPNLAFGPQFTDEVNPPNTEPASFLKEKGKAWQVVWNGEPGKLPVFWDFPYQGLKALYEPSYQISTKCQNSVQVKKGSILGYATLYNTKEFGNLKGWVKVKMQILKPCQVDNSEDATWQLFYPLNFAKGAENIIKVIPV